MKCIALASLLILAASSLVASTTPVLVGQTVTLTVTADGTVPFIYVWSKNGTVISGATINPLILTNVQLAGSGTYTCVVSNSAGSTISDNAIINVSVPVVAPANAVISVTAH